MIPSVQPLSCRLPCEQRKSKRKVLGNENIILDSNFNCAEPAMWTEIQGMRFLGFAAFDRQNLPKLDYAGRVGWLKHRIDLVFLTVPPENLDVSERMGIILL